MSLTPSAAEKKARELGIAEHNLFLMLSALGLSAPVFGVRLLPIGGTRF